MKKYLLAILLATISGTAISETPPPPTNHSAPISKIKIAPIKINPTGNSSADSMLQKFAAANKDNPAAIAALNSAAADVKSNPAQYINQDGSLNVEKLKSAITKAFSNVGSVAIQPPDNLVNEGSTGISSAGQR